MPPVPLALGQRRDGPHRALGWAAAFLGDTALVSTPHATMNALCPGECPPLHGGEAET